ncbi:MAG: type II toxin-antitoxin system VapC family toxin [Chitinivibrionales bacterium]|nr:type II toxin-antitoxin system VapC family toxin [Chitinivibrionales bacterium]
MDKSFVLDTSALFAFIQDEEGADRVQKILVSGKKNECKIYISFITIAELYYVTCQEKSESAAIEIVAQIKALPISILESEESLTLAAARIKAHYRLSLGDAFIAATALRISGVLVHKDPEFEQLEHFILLEALPFKSLPGKKK